MSDRYFVQSEEEDEYGFEHFVYRERNGQPDFICGCVIYEDANLVAKALNDMNDKPI